MDVGAESRFPDGVTFSITAQSSEEIDEIRVFFRKVGQTGLSTYRSVDFEPGKLVTGESILSSSGGGDYFPPGTSLQFSFEVRDKAGGVLRTPEQDFVYHDNRFEWLSVSSGLVTVYYYGEYVEQRANTVLEAAEEAMEIMVPLLGIQTYRAPAHCFLQQLPSYVDGPAIQVTSGAGATPNRGLGL